VKGLSLEVASELFSLKTQINIFKVQYEISLLLDFEIGYNVSSETKNVRYAWIDDHFHNIRNTLFSPTTSPQNCMLSKKI
jgi:hypothetical protein